MENYLAAESSLGSAGLDELRWPHPVRPGDTLRVRATVVESRRSLSKPDRGIIKTVVEAANSGGATVMRATAVNFMLVRPDPVRDMLYAFGFERVGVVVGDLYFVNPRAARGQEGAEHGVRLEVRMLGRGALKGSPYSARPIEIGQPVWRADLLESVDGPVGSLDRAHHHPAFAGWNPGRRVYVSEMSATRSAGSATAWPTWTACSPRPGSRPPRPGLATRRACAPPPPRSWR